jgi:hypothetical protein
MLSLPEGWQIQGNDFLVLQDGRLPGGSGDWVFISGKCPPTPQSGDGGFYGRPATAKKAVSFCGIMRRLRDGE